jgi:hypothetical protein
MAVLEATRLTGCSSIPGFIVAGTKMIFENATPPTSWTKDTAHNNKALRVVNTTSLNPGGTTAFTSVFTGTRAVSGTVAQAATGMSVNQSVNNTSGQIVSMPAAQTANVSISPRILTTAQIDRHDHNYSVRGGPQGLGSVNRAQGTPAVQTSGDRSAPSPFPTLTSGPTGQGGAHTHVAANQTHVHTLGGGVHNHGLSATQHNHTFTGTAQNFAVTYVDLIIAIKS